MGGGGLKAWGKAVCWVHWTGESWYPLLALLQPLWLPPPSFHTGAASDLLLLGRGHQYRLQQKDDTWGDMSVRERGDQKE